jgi:(p)ppGpp synthase/HD superfamily hydrolase
MTGFSPLPLDELGGWSLAQIAELAADAHAEQLDKAGRPYIEHPFRVARLLADRGEPPLRKALGLLHDAVEDTTVTLSLLAELGLPERLIAGVDALSHRTGEPHEAYYRRVLDNPDAVPVKLADIDDNSGPERLHALESPVRQRLEVKYSRARRFLTTEEPPR